jgi:hypothetical protein
MIRPRCVGRLPILLALGFALTTIEAGLAAGATEPAEAVAGPRPRTASAQTTKGAAKTAHRAAKTTGHRAHEAPARGAPSAKARSNRSKLAARQAVRGPTQTINDDVQITPFPSHADAARKALAQNRRDQLDDAEKAARDPGQPDRWQTVLFHLREFDSRSDAEACFWRVIAYYRLGEVGRARTVRQSCDIGAKDQAIIEKEDAQSASLQPAAALPELAAAGDRVPAPVPNPAGYDGDPPAHFER